MKNSRPLNISILSFLLVMFSLPETLAQSAWTKKKGELYSQISYNTIPAYSEIYSDGTYITGRTITDNTIQLYGEYGLSDNLTFLVNIPLKSIQTGDIQADASLTPSIIEASQTSLGNIQLGLRQKIYEGKVVLSGQLNVAANTSSFDNASGIRTGFDAWTFTPTFNIGRGYSKYFFQAFTGVDIRTNSYSSNFKIGGEFGLTSIKNTTLIAFVDIVKSFKNGDVILPTSLAETALYINDQEYTAVGLKGLYNFTDNYGITLGVGGALSATNVPKQLALSAGFFYKLN